jgi:PAS domain S-box-containing protein
MIRVLLVDDEEPFLELTKFFLLRQPGIEVETATSAKEAMAKMSGSSFDAVVSDYMMPAMNGIEFLKILRLEGMNTPFILLTGKGGEEVAIEALNSGADFYLQKGRDPLAQQTELLHTVSRLVAYRKSEEALAESEQRYRMLAESAPEYIYIIGSDRKISYVNAFAAAQLGLPIEDIVGKSLDNFFPLEVSRRLISNVGKVLADGKTLRVENKIIYPGREAWLDTVLAPLRDLKGQVHSVLGVSRDVTERMTFEEELRNSEVRLRLITDNLQDMVAQIDAKGVYLYASPSHKSVLGYESKDLIGKSLFEFINPEDLDTVVGRFKSASRTSVATALDVRFRHSGGHYVWLSTVAKPMFDSDGTMVGAIMAARDVTSRKKAEDSLRERDDQLKKLFLHVPGMIYQFKKRPDGTYCVPFTSDAIKGIFGCSPQDVREDFAPIAKAILPSDFDRVVASIEHSAEHLTLWECEYRVQIPGHPIRWVFGRSTPEKLADGSIVWHGFNTDITEHKMAEEMLRTSEEKYRHLVDLAQEGILTTDQNAVIQFANPRMVEMLGYVVDEMVGKSLFEFMNEEASVLARRKFEDRRRGLTGRYELDFLRKDRALVRTCVAGIPTKDQDGDFSGTLVVVTDITDRKGYEETLEVANKKLNLLSQVTRHDLLNQLSVLMGWLGIVQETVTEPAVKKHLALMEKAANAIRKELEFTIDYESVGAEAPAWIDVDRACRQGISGLDLEGVTTTIDLAGVEILADRMLEKVFHNLTDNSIRHGKNTKHIAIHYEESKEGLTVIFEDDGVGVPDADKERIFQRGEGKHTGYGLDLVKGILSITRIKIKETGVPGKGAKFELLVTPSNYRIVLK